MSVCQHAETSELRVVLKLVQRAVIVGASAPLIVSAVGGADLLGQAHAESPQCIANATDLCAPPVGDAANTSSPPRIQMICQPAGPKGGASCPSGTTPMS